MSKSIAFKPTQHLKVAINDLGVVCIFNGGTARPPHTQTS
jgi:hypothetical protein